jgi:hypothetical protein
MEGIYDYCIMRNVHLMRATSVVKVVKFAIPRP